MCAFVFPFTRTNFSEIDFFYFNNNIKLKYFSINNFIFKEEYHKKLLLSLKVLPFLKFMEITNCKFKIFEELNENLEEINLSNNFYLNSHLLNFLDNLKNLKFQYKFNICNNLINNLIFAEKERVVYNYLFFMML